MMILFGPNTNRFGINDEKRPSWIAVFQEMFEGIKHAADNFLFVHLGDVNNNNAMGVADGKLGDIAEIVVEGQQDAPGPLSVGKDGLVIGTAKTDFAGMDSIKTILNSSGKWFGKNSRGFISQSTGVFEGRQNVLFGDTRVLNGDFIKGIAGGKQVKDINDGNAGATDARFAETNFGINSNFVHDNSFVNRSITDRKAMSNAQWLAGVNTAPVPL